jgi:hypothetical protein
LSGDFLGAMGLDVLKRPKRRIHDLPNEHRTSMGSLATNSAVV